MAMAMHPHFRLSLISAISEKEDCKIQTEWVPWLQNPAPYNNAGFQIRNALDPVVLFSSLNEHLYSVECRASRIEREELRA